MFSLSLFGLLLSFQLPAFADSDDVVVRECLEKWGKTPFDKAKPKYRTISTRVKVIGIGGDVVDANKTEKPELILVKPAVSVMSKTSYQLMNPNGWYCLKGRVSVMGKIDITLNCKAKIASSKDDVSVMGATDNSAGGVSVLGSIRLNRICN